MHHVRRTSSIYVHTPGTWYASTGCRCSLTCYGSAVNCHIGTYDENKHGQQDAHYCCICAVDVDGYNRRKIGIFFSSVFFNSVLSLISFIYLSVCSPSIYHVHSTQYMMARIIRVCCTTDVRTLLLCCSTHTMHAAAVLLILLPSCYHHRVRCARYGWIILWTSRWIKRIAVSCLFLFSQYWRDNLTTGDKMNHQYNRKCNGRLGMYECITMALIFPNIQSSLYHFQTDRREVGAIAWYHYAPKHKDCINLLLIF